MLEIKSLGTITDQAIANTYFRDDEFFYTPITFDDLNDKTKEAITRDICYKRNQGETTLNMDCINEIYIVCLLNIEEKRMYVRLDVDYENPTPKYFDPEKGLYHQDVIFGKREYNRFIKEIIVPYFSSFTKIDMDWG